MKRSTALVALTAFVLTTTAGLLIAGPLNPPAGSVASTYKTLGEVEPRMALNSTNTPGDVANQFKITQPGSYYLTGDMTVSPGANPCILITASNVTLDLNGFNVRAVAAEGIRIGGDRVTVRNGSISLPAGSADGVYVLSGADGVQLLGMKIGAPSACVRVQSAVESIVIRESELIGGAFGVSLSGTSTAATLVAVECRGQSNASLNLSDSAFVDGCTIRGTGNAGGASGYSLYVGSGSTIRNTLVFDSGSTGADRAILTGAGATIEGCTVYSRGSMGIRVFDTAVLRNNRVTMLSAAAVGIYASGGDCFIADNSVSAPSGSGIALNTGTGSTVVRNHLINATTPITGSNLSGNIIGPTASNGNPTASTNPHANFVN